MPLRAQEVTGLLGGGSWSREEVAEGIVLHRAAFEGNLFDANQYLCVLEVAPGARFDIVPSDEEKLELTSALAARYGAVAAVNGSFFNMRAPYGSVNYLRVDGDELAPNARDSYENRGRGRGRRRPPPGKSKVGRGLAPAMATTQNGKGKPLPCVIPSPIMLRA